MAILISWTECGKFLALDLGGTNFRVLLIELGPHIFHMVTWLFIILLIHYIPSNSQLLVIAGVENLCRPAEHYARSWNRGKVEQSSNRIAFKSNLTSC